MITKNKTIKEAFKKSPFFISYLITDPLEYGKSIEKFTTTLTNTLSKYKVDILCFRDKETLNIEELAKTCLTISKQFNIKKVLINSNIDLAIKLGFDGVHLTSLQFDKIQVSKQKSLFTIISCHTEDEVNIAKINGADCITYSPIFYKENKGLPKGIKKLTNIVEKYQTSQFNIIALGGIIDENHLEKIKKTNSAGFASIRYFIN